MISAEILEKCPARVLFTDGYFCKQTDGNILCSDYTDCPYKQLQHLKKENEKLRFPQKDLSYAVLSKEEFEDIINEVLSELHS